jgi:transposase
MRGKIFDGALNTAILIDFLRRLIKGAPKKIFLILDNLRVHHAKPVKAWLSKHHEAIEVFYLPSYSPEPNPDEMANADLKQAVTNLALACTKLQLVCAACSGGPSASAATSSTSRFAMPPDSSSLMSDQ